MKEELSEQSRSDLLAILSDGQKEVLKLIEKGSPPIRPIGFGITQEEYKQLSIDKVGRTTAGMRLKKLVEDGVLEYKDCKSRDSVNGRTTRVYFTSGTWPES